MKIELEIENCGDCPFKTEYSGDPEDYWLCDLPIGNSRFRLFEVKDMTIIHPDCQLGKVVCKKLKPPEGGGGFVAPCARGAKF